jgi:flagellar motor switch protein FliN/FliY
MVSMADPTPDPQPTNAADAEADALADELLSMGTFADATDSGGGSVSSAASGAGPQVNEDEVAPDLAELEALLKQAGFDGPGDNIDLGAPADPHALADQLIADAHAAASPGRPMPATQAFDLPAFQQAISESQASSIDLLRDVELNVKIELGRSRMLVEDVLKLNEGAVVELDKLAGDPVDVFVNDRLVARGEVLVLNDNFCVRVNEIVATVKEEG